MNLQRDPSQCESSIEALQLVNLHMLSQKPSVESCLKLCSRNTCMKAKECVEFLDVVVFFRYHVLQVGCDTHTCTKKDLDMMLALALIAIFAVGGVSVPLILCVSNHRRPQGTTILLESIETTVTSSETLASLTEF